jgi:hypothetical protein
MPKPLPIAVDHSDARTALRTMRKRHGMIASLRRRWRWCLLAICVVGSYPAFVLGTVYATTSRSDLPGGRHGPKDAYRHSLASAIVAYTGSPAWVEWVTMVMERDGKGDAACAMDAHNNRLGARIGAQATSWNEMRTAVLNAVMAGGVTVDDQNRITWLPPERWQNRLY